MLQRELTILPVISISPSKICTYSEVHWSPEKPRRGATFVNLDPNQPLNPKFINSERSANGLISNTARKKIYTALDYLLLMSNEKKVKIHKLNKTVKFRICFVTLTLPSKQIHTDNEIKTMCLNSFLIELTRFYQVKNYIWRAEKQQNGNIHFHFIFDKFILYNELRKRWNRIMNKLGYVDRYATSQKEWHKNGFRPRPWLFDHWPIKEQYNAYLFGVKTDWRSPNSTDIHKVRYINNIKAYVSKYLSKNELVLIRIVHKCLIDKKELTDDEQKKFNKLTKKEIEKYKSMSLVDAEKNIVNGRLWACNQELSDIKNAREYIDSEIEKALQETVKKSECKTFSSDYFNVYYISIDQLKELSPDVLFLYFARYMSEHFKFSMQLVI